MKTASSLKAEGHVIRYPLSGVMVSHWLVLTAARYLSLFLSTLSFTKDSDGEDRRPCSPNPPSSEFATVFHCTTRLPISQWPLSPLEAPLNVAQLPQPYSLHVPKRWSGFSYLQSCLGRGWHSYWCDKACTSPAPDHALSNVNIWRGWETRRRTCQVVCCSIG
jgi:hypothetical protein